MKRIAVIGAGNMGGALARCWAGAFGGGSLAVANPSAGKLQKLQESFPDIAVTSSNREAAQSAETVVIAVKPWHVTDVLNELCDIITAGHKTVISVAAGVTTGDIAKMLGVEAGALPIVYCIPNTSVSVGRGVVFYTTEGFNAAASGQLAALLAPLGKAIEVAPTQMQAGMAVASCGIAYAMRYIRAAVLGGVELGLKPADAQEAVMHTLEGAVALLEANGSHPEAEIDKVTTPGGLTIRGLNAMEAAGFSASVAAGLRASK